MLSGIYCIKNIINNKIYVGSSKDIEKRWQEHRSKLRSNNHENSKLQNSWNKHGEDNFLFSILFECDDVESILLDTEQDYLDSLLPFGDIGYNIQRKAGRIEHNEETIKKMSESLKRKWKEPEFREKQKNKYHGPTTNKITKEIAEEIRVVYAEGKTNQTELGKRFGVSQDTVSLIIRGKIWKD